MTTPVQVVTTLVEAGENALAGHITKLAMLTGAGPIQALIVRAFDDAIGRGGLLGPEKVAAQLASLIDGEDVVLDFTDEQLANDLISAMAHAAHDKKSAFRDFVAEVEDTLGPILVEVLRLAPKLL